MAHCITWLRAAPGNRAPNCLVLLAITATSCVGSIATTHPAGGGGDGSGAQGGPGGSGGSGTGGAPAAAPACNVDIAPLRRLNQVEYENTLHALKVLRPDQTSIYVITDESVGGFAVNTGAPVTDDSVAQYRASARRLVPEVVLSDVLGCDPGQMGEDPCAHQFIDTFGRRAFRRPLDDDERATFVDLYRRKKARSNFEGGVRHVLAAFLQFPQFLYRNEIGIPVAGHPELLALTGHEIATRLSYFLWASTPDDDLLDAAAAGELSSPQGIEKQARRMMMDPRFSDALRSFYLQWLGLESFEDVVKMVPISPGTLSYLSVAMKDAARKETLRFLDHVIREGDGKLETLFSAGFSFVSPAIAGIYHVTLPGSGDLQRVDLPKNERAGLLTQMSLLARLATGAQTSPIRRGVFVRRHVLCQDLPDPPAAVVKDAVPPDGDAHKTTRQRFEEKTKPAACAGCHNIINPIGYGFEHYDTYGQYSAREWTNAADTMNPPTYLDLDTTFDLTGTTIDGQGSGAGGKYADAVDFATHLATSRDLRECVAEQHLRFVLGRPINRTGIDSCVFDDLGRAFAEGGHRIPDLLVALSRSDAFRYLKVQ